MKHIKLFEQFLNEANINKNEDYVSVDTDPMMKEDILDLQDFLDNTGVNWYMDNKNLVFNLIGIPLDDKELILKFLKDKLK